MVIGLVLLGLVLLVYFHLAQVRPEHVDTSGNAHLPSAWIPVNVVRVLFCLSPAFLLARGYALEDGVSVLICCVCIVLVQPMEAPSASDPEDAEDLALGSFVVAWLLTRLDRAVKLGFLALVLWGVTWLASHAVSLPDVDTWLGRFRAPGVPQLPEPVHISGALYVAIGVMCVIKALMLSSYRSWLLITSTFGVVVYVYNLTQQLPREMEEWEAIGGGLLSALVVGCAFSYSVALLRRASEARERADR